MIRAKQSQSAWRGRVGRGLRAWDVGQSCETKPIRPRIARNEPNWAWQGHVATGKRCETNPIPGGAGCDGAVGARDAGLSCKTNPIWPGFGGAGSRQAKDAKRTQFATHHTEAGGTNRAKQTQLGLAGPGPRRAKDAKRTQFPATPDGTGPQGRGTRGKCAKRTQFPAGRISHHSSILSFHHSKPMSIVRNKANFPGSAHRADRESVGVKRPHRGAWPAQDHGPVLNLNGRRQAV
jgi:hypothetical protein